MAKTIGGRRVTKGQKVGQSNIVPVLDTALDFVPGIGDAKAFAEAETPWEYGLAGLGLVPGLGDAAAGALKAVTPLFKNPLEKGFKMTRNEAKKFKEQLGIDPESERALRVLADMKREYKDPSLAKTPSELVPLRVGENPMTYKPYQLDDGRWLHGTYDKEGNFVNVLGGNRKKVPEEKDFPPILGEGPIGKRPGKDFMVNTENSYSSSQDVLHPTLGDALKPKAVAPLAPTDGLTAKQRKYKERLLAKDKLTDEEQKKLRELGG